MNYIESRITTNVTRPTNPRIPMRTKITNQPSFPLVISSNLPKECRDFQLRYERISDLLDDCSTCLGAFHKDAARSSALSGRNSTFSSENFLRMGIVKTMEGLSLRDTIIRVFDSDFLRNFTRIFSGEMMNFSELQSVMKCITPETWDKINILLFNYAHKEELITGRRLRVDSTVCESNIHYPTDASLLWDCYRVAARLIRQSVEAEPSLDMGNRFHLKKAKRYYTFIATHSTKQRSKRAVRRQMNKLIKMVEWINTIVMAFVRDARPASFGAMGLIEDLRQLLPLAERVVACARRVYQGETVPAADRIFSIFEPHTELLKRGKAHKPNEFGHMVTIGQTREKFISFYRVEEQSRHDLYLGDEAKKDHRKKFGCYPREFTADKNYYGGPEHSARWMKRIRVYSVGKKGKRDEEETRREHGMLFRLLQKFRAGCEGSISVLKRVFGLIRCLNRGFKSFASTIGSIVFCHNLVVLSRL
jgi:IS5 family transposase